MRDLSMRQRQYLELFMQGHSEKQIAGLLGLSQKTVSTHKLVLKKRIGAKSDIDLVRYGLKIEQKKKSSTEKMIDSIRESAESVIARTGGNVPVITVPIPGRKK